MNINRCKYCEDNDDFYGCTNEDCSVYQDIKADSELQDHLDNMKDGKDADEFWDEEQTANDMLEDMNEKLDKVFEADPVEDYNDFTGAR